MATEAAWTALRDAFERGRLSQIISFARQANTASIRIMKKLGHKLQCEFESAGVPVVGYAIDRSSLGQKVIADEPSPSNVKAAQ
jgi:RimJ/RimL family protein N-acetyltransferase